MSTAEKITVAITLLGTAGFGAMIKSLVDYALSRRHQVADLTEKAVKTADVLMTRQDAALARAQQENEALRVQLTNVTVEWARSFWEIHRLRAALQQLTRDGLVGGVDAVLPPPAPEER